MKPKRWALLLLLLLLASTLSGCWNKAEIEEGAYVLAIGIDKGDSSPIKLTAAVAKPQKLAGGGKGGGGGDEKEGGLMVTSVEAPSLSSALTTLSAYIGRAVNLHHARVLFYHEELAREEGLLIMDALMRFHQIRETLFFVVTKEPAAVVMKKLNPQLEQNPIRYVEQLTYNYRRTGVVPATSQLSAVAANMNVNYAQPLTYYAALSQEKTDQHTANQAEAEYLAGQLPREGGADVEMVGAAAFHGKRMVGVLNGAEMRYLLMLQNQFRQAFASFTDPREPDKFIGVRLSRGRGTQYRVERLGERPQLRVKIILEAEVIGIQSGVDYSDPRNQSDLEQALTKQIQAPLQKVIEKTQGWESDVAAFGSHLVSQFPTVEAWERYDWPSRFPKAEIKADVQVKVRRYGLILSPVKAR